MTVTVRHLPIFDTVPGSDFVSGWHLHVAKTGYPETFPGVSTVRPESLEGVRFLTDEIKVVTSLREGGSWAPCALCRPNSPKCQKGRLAWFAAGKTVCFVGGHCAKKYMGEDYAVAQKLWERQSRSRAVIARWPELQKRLLGYEAFASAILPAARALQWMHETLSEDAPVFRVNAYDALKWSQGLIRHWKDIGIKDPAGKPVLQQFELGQVRGYEFLKKEFHPHADLKRIQETMRMASTPLPVPSDDEDQDTMRDIINAGRRAFAIPKDLNAIAAAVSSASQFFSDANLRLFGDWFKTGESQWSTLEFRREGNVILLRSESADGAAYCNLTVLKEINAELPPKLEEFA